MQQANKNILYLYDLPKDSTTSIKIAQALKDQAGVTIDTIPQIKKSDARPFYNAMVKIDNPNQVEVAKEKMKYFKIDGKQCRALPFDLSLLGENKKKINDQNVFVKNIPEDMSIQELEDKFKQFGDIKSVKISLNPDHSSRGYGFICFQSPDGATNAIQYKGPIVPRIIDNRTVDLDLQPYNPKDRRDIRKVFNNIYVKDFPESYGEPELRKLFSQYGPIISLTIGESAIGKYAFVCYGDSEDSEVGPKSAMRAVAELNDQKLDGSEKPLYVREALKKQDRVAQKQAEKLRYKNSKKRCNLYVKNFAPNTTEADLEALFSQYGQIEHIKLNNEDPNKSFAFVCYKSPEDAMRAKSALVNYTHNGKQLYVNHYEIKEVRKAQQEQLRDQADFAKYKQSQIQQNPQELLNNPNTLAMLSQLLAYVQPRLMGGANRGQGPRGPGGYNNNQRNFSQPRPHTQAGPNQY